MAASLIDVFGRLLLDGDGREFVKSAVKAGEKAGDQAGKSMGQRLAGSLKSNMGGALRAIGGGAALVFGAMSAGAMQLEEIQARFRAETGATADEAKAAAAAINKVAGSERASLEAVAEAAIRVRKDLGATGEAANELTEDFVRFARVTRQDAAQAVSDYDDILDAWGLTAEDAAGLQDKLLASNQRFGGSIVANQQALGQLAPQLRALGADVDDGIGLLNLFAASGLDAGAAAGALKKAVAGLKPGQTLDDLIAQISSIEDPTLRAQAAMEVFGARGGAGLANALQPGIDSLDDFMVSAEESAGATDRAAEALDSTFGARFKKLMSEAGAALRGFGAEWGSVLTGAAALASLGGSLGLDRVLAKAFGKLAGSALVKGAATKAGLIIGAIFSGAMFVADQLAGALGGALGKLPGAGLVKAGAGKLGALLGSTLGGLAAAGFAAILLVEVVNTYNRIKAELGEQLKAIDSDVQAQIKSGTDEALATQKAALEKGIADLNGVWDFGLFTGEARDKLTAELDATNAEIERRAAGIGPALAEGIGDGSGPVAAAAQNMYAGMTPAGATAVAQAKQNGLLISGELAAGIREKRSAVDAAMAQLVEDLKNAMSPAKEQAKLVGLLTSKELAKGLASNDPLVRAQAESTRAIIEQRLAEVILAGGKAGKKAQEELAAGLKSKDPAVRAQAQRTQAIVEHELDRIAALKAGREAGQDLADGVDDKKGAVAAAARRLGNALYVGFLNKIAIMEERFGGGATVPGMAEGGHARAGSIQWVGERGRELWVPDVAGTVVPEGDISMGPPAPAPAPAQPTSYSTTIVLPERHRDELEVLERASWYQRHGLINPRPRTDPAGA